MQPRLPAGYDWHPGSRRDRDRIRGWLEASLQETFPQQTGWQHLQATVDQHFDPPHTPCWWIRWQQDPVGCLWLGASVDQITGNQVAYLFLLRVDPGHRRRGLGRLLLAQAEQWASEQHLSALSLQVFSHSQAALELYQQSGFLTQGFWLSKALSTDSSPSLR